MVKTNDPREPEIRLTLSGRVEKFATIDPEFVYFNGKVKEIEAVTLEITPNSTAGFRITQVVPDKPRLFSAELIEPCDESNTSCRIRVTNLVKKKARYTGVIHVKTDSRRQPRFTIVVRAKIS